MPWPVVAPIFLLVGKQERMANDANFQVNPTESDMTNYQDLSNVWIVINPLTGLVNTDAMADGSAAALSAYNSTTGTEAEKLAAAAAAGLQASRDLARDFQGMGGR